METTSLPVRSSPERATELFELIKAFRIAQDAGDRLAALRFIDRAWRIASKNPEINYLYGLWLVRDGSVKAALSLLETAAASGNDPNIEAVYISALCADGSIDHARVRLQKALGRFATAADSPLADAARQVAAACQPQIAGWIGVGPDLKLLGELVGDHGTAPLRLLLGQESSRILMIDCDGQSFSRFETDIDGSATDGLVEASVHDAPLLGSNLALPPDFGFDGRASISDAGISGWAALRWDPARTLEITLSDGNGFAASVSAQPDLVNGQQYFSFDRAAAKAAGNNVIVTATMPNGKQMPLPGSPFLVRPAPPPARGNSARPAKVVTAKAVERRDVDIVIPVYAGLDETLSCITSVRKTIGAEAKIIVIDDASPDPRIGPALDALERNGTIILLRNAANLGFPETVNRGLGLHTDRDVVILNADTEVFGDWLGRLRSAAYSSPDVGTVTPLTNSGSIASYPTSEEPALGSITAAERDSLAAQVNKGLTVDIPTGVGFCMYVRRDCIADVGLFDTDTFSKGYGEENDFCLRGAALGWRHLLAADVFVRHIGSRSFGGLRAALFDRNIRLLNLRHPGYDATIAAYSERDPPHDIRRRLDDARLMALNEKFVLLVSLGLNGGVRRAVDERAAQIKSEGITPIVLKPDPDHIGRYALTVDAQVLEDLYFNRSEIDQLIDLLGRLSLSHIEIHHILDLPDALIDRLYDLGCPIDVQIHDYIWYCPRINLLDESGRYCGEPGIAGCRACIKKNGSLFAEHIEVGALRKRSARWLQGARRITVPTQSVAKRMAVHFPKSHFEIQPLENSALAVPFGQLEDKVVKVAVIGAIGAHKGFDILLEMAENASKRALPLEFVVIGYTQDDKALTDTGRVFVTGEYEEYELEQLITRERPDVALFLSQFPETWCYSLTHALNMKIPVAGYDFGAIGDRLGKMLPAPLLFPRSSTATALCDGLLAAFPVSTGVEAGGRYAKTDILINVPAPRNAVSLRRDMTTTPNLPSASVEFLPLSQGLYLFSVKSAQQAYRVDEENGIALPAIQLSCPPGVPPGNIELMLSPHTATAWLCEPHDQIVVKVNVPSCIVLLTSVIIPGMTPLEIEVQRLDRTEPVAPIQVEAPQAPVQREVPLPPATHESLPIKIIPHVQNHGDLEFSNGQWAGLVREGLWIESFSISPLAELTPDMIEYKAVTATGVETPWVSGGSPCGTRGIGVPLIGLAIRIKPQAGVQGGMCEYGAMLLSGATLGPARNGVPCRSPDANDAICGLWVSISGTAPVVAAKAADPAPEMKPKAKKPAAAAGKAKAAIGPRFSAFREQGNQEQE